MLSASCEEAARHLSDYTEGELGAFRRWRVARHLAICERCRAALRTLGATMATLRALGGVEPAPAPDLPAAVRRRIEEGP
jgi:anti-sigma factor RsiW